MGARPAGRHGPIALVDEGELVVFIMPPERGRDVLHAKVRSGIEEVKSRGAFIIAVAEQGDRDDERYADVVFRRPECPTLMSPLVDVVPLQPFAMDMAEIKGYDVDKPRNLAKSVTVEWTRWRRTRDDEGREMTNNKDKWLRALQAKGIRTPQDEVGRAGRHRHDDPEANPPKDRAGFRPVRGRSAKPFKATGHKGGISRQGA